MPVQTDTIQRLSPNARVAVVRLRSLGDCVLSTPALELLKRARPDLSIGVVAEDRFADVFRGHPAVDAVLPPSARAVRNFAPELCLNLHGGSRSARLTLLSGAAVRAGFDIFRPAWVYNTPVPTAQEILGLTRRVHTAEHAAAAMFYLGVPLTEIPRASVPAAAGRSAHAPAGPYSVIHPAAATPEKTWPAGRFIEIAKRLPFEPVFIGGPGDDLSPFGAWKTMAGAPLAEVARLMRDASLFVGNDSGPAHVAAAFGVPVVVLFGPSDAEIWSPWRTAAQVLQAVPMDGIATDDVLRAVERLAPVKAS